MSGYLNRAQLIGNLGADPEIRITQSGGKIANFSVATTESWKDDHGNRVERTEWHRVVIFSEGLATTAERYLRKGSKVFVEGQLRTRKWQDAAGADRYSTEITLNPYAGTLTFLDNKPGGNGQRGTNHPPATGNPANEPESETALDDEVPF